MNVAGHLNVRWLGRMEFARALALQEELAAKKRENASFDDQLLLLEHEPVYTIGRTTDRSSLSARGGIRGGELGGAHLPHPVFSINRGCQATYHGPGQLMGYPIIDQRRCGQDLHKYLRCVCGDLSPFDHIVPCGINNVAITSMEKEAKKSFTVAAVAPMLEKLALDSIVSLRVAPETQLINA